MALRHSARHADRHGVYAMIWGLRGRCSPGLRASMIGSVDWNRISIHVISVSEFTMHRGWIISIGSLHLLSSSQTTRIEETSDTRSVGMYIVIWCYALVNARSHGVGLMKRQASMSIRVIARERRVLTAPGRDTRRENCELSADSDGYCCPGS